MINVHVILEMLDFEPNDDDAEELEKYLNYELNGIESEYGRIPKYFRNLLKRVKEILS